MLIMSVLIMSGDSMSRLYENAHNLNLHFLQHSSLDSLKISDFSEYENYVIKKTYGEARQFEQLCRYFERLIARAPEYSSVARIPLKIFNIINDFCTKKIQF